MLSIDRLPPGGNSGPIAVRPGVAPGQHPDLARIAPGRNRSLDQLKADGGYSDRAKLTAQAHEDRCRRADQWLTWPHASTTAADNGWDATEHGGRKKVQRGNRELIDGGDLVKLRLGELAGWFDAHGAALGLAWPEKLQRWRKGLWVTVLRWRIPEPARPGACDGGVAPGQYGQDTLAVEPHPFGGECRTRPDRSVALGPTEVSHPIENVRTEPTTETTSVPDDDDGLAGAPQGEGEASMAGPTAADHAREAYARKIIRRCEGEGWTITPEGELEVQAGPRNEPSAGHRADLRKFWPEVRAIRFPPPKRRAGPAAVPEKPPRAPKVDRAAAARARRVILELARNPDPRASDEAGRAIGEALGDLKPASALAFRAYAERARLGRGLGPADLLDAFEAGCSGRAFNRGSIVVAAVKGLLGAAAPVG